jgi:hypothetical protein
MPGKSISQRVKHREPVGRVRPCAVDRFAARKIFIALTVVRP